MIFVDKWGWASFIKPPLDWLFVTGKFYLSGYLAELKSHYFVYEMSQNVCIDLIESLIAKQSIISNVIFEHIFFAFPTRTYLHFLLCVQTNSGICKKKGLVQMQTTRKGKYRQWRKERQKRGKLRKKSFLFCFVFNPKRTGLHMRGMFSR